MTLKGVVTPRDERPEVVLFNRENNLIALEKEFK